MTFWWLLFWLIDGADKLHMWNVWAVSLIVCLAIDIFGGSKAV